MMTSNPYDREDELWRRNNSLRNITEQSRTLPEGEIPDMYDLPEYPRTGVGVSSGSSSGGQLFNAPRWDNEKITALTQKRAMPGIRSLRDQVQRVTGRRYDNPQVARMTLREALASYGQGLGSVISSAGNAAVNEYSQEYDALADAAKTSFLAKERRSDLSKSLSAKRNESKFQAEIDRRKLMFQNLYDKWRSGGSDRTVSYNERTGY